MLDNEVFGGLLLGEIKLRKQRVVFSAETKTAH
jgi:hypothetical protein